MLGGTHGQPIEIEIANSDPFFPNLNVRDFLESRRVPASLAPALITEKFSAAIFQVNRRLSVWKRARTAEGNAKLENIAQPRLMLGEEERRELVFHYRQAVFGYAMGELHPDIASLMARDEAMAYQDKMERNAQRHYDQANDSIRRIKGETRCKTNPTGLFSALV